MKKSRHLFLAVGIMGLLCSGNIKAEAGRNVFGSEILVVNDKYVLFKKASANYPQKDQLVLIKNENNSNNILTEDLETAISSSDGSKIAYTEYKESGFWIYDFANNTTLRISDKPCYNLIFSDDGKKIFYLTVEGEERMLVSLDIDQNRKEIIYTINMKEWR